jgi:hypothetical protein
MCAMEYRFTIFRDSHDNIGKEFQLPWDDLARRLAEHREGPKDGLAITCGLFDGHRSSKRLVARHLVALDVETGANGVIPLNPQDIANYIRAKQLAAVIWTTHSHKPAAPRYRVLLPLSKPLYPAKIGKGVDRALSAVTASNLRLKDCVDRGKFGAASLMFLARHPKDAEFYAEVIEGVPINAGQLFSVSYMSHEKHAMDAAQKLALRQTTEMPPEVRLKIERYNALYEIEDLLASHGYSRRGDRWKSPYQHASSQPATSIFPDGRMWASFSESDKDAGLGTASDDCIFGDAFALYLHFDHKGNFRTALAGITLPEGAGDAT